MIFCSCKTSDLLQLRETQTTSSTQRMTEVGVMLFTVKWTLVTITWGCQRLVTHTANDTGLMVSFVISNFDDICVCDDFLTSGTLHDVVSDDTLAVVDDDPTALRDCWNITEFHRGCLPGHLLTQVLTRERCLVTNEDWPGTGTSPPNYTGDPLGQDKSVQSSQEMMFSSDSINMRRGVERPPGSCWDTLEKLCFSWDTCWVYVGLQATLSCRL